MRGEKFTSAPERDARLMALPGSRIIGQSEEGRPIIGVVLGHGPLHVSLLAGAHADEPVGAETLLQLAEQWSASPPAGTTAVIVPHVNPEGEAMNRSWIDAWPNDEAHAARRLRELPGRDIEYGYPSMRVENQAMSKFLTEHGPYALHLSLHGMSQSTGIWMLIHESWADRTVNLRRQWTAAVHEAGYKLLDWDRRGEKGFKHLGPGFATTPSGQTMREHFRALGDDATAAKFHNSSMEFIRSLPDSEDALCIVTEIPLWITTGVVQTPVPISTATRLQKRALELAIETATVH